MLDKNDATEWAHDLLRVRKAEAEQLDLIHSFWRGSQPLPTVPSGVPVEVRRMAEMSRVNVLGLVVDTISQSMYVSGYRQEREIDDAPAWTIWQANKLDAGQTGVHRAALAYGTAYVLVLPGEPQVVIRGASPRRLTAVYGDSDEWPRLALESRVSGRRRTYRLYDDEAVYVFEDTSESVFSEPEPRLLDVREHGMGVCPVVRFRNVVDLEGESHGEIETLIPLQRQLDAATFDLQVAQHYTAFRQRYVLGWLAEDESQKLKASASRLLTFEDPDVKVGEFSQTDLSGYLESRESTLQHLATISQVPPHHLLGKMVNLSAEALAAAEAGQRRKIAEREVTFGESWEQVLGLAARYQGLPVSEGAEVRWRDTEARSLSQTIDALGKLVALLGVPAEEVWDRVPGVTQQDVSRWRAAAKANDSLANLTAILDRQADINDGA